MSLGRVVSRTLAVTLLTLPLLSCSGSWVALLAQPAASQEASKPFVAWAREHAIPVVTTEPGQGVAPYALEGTSPAVSCLCSNG
jgi:hypothetical protein